MTPKIPRPATLKSTGFMLETWCGKMFANFSHDDQKMLREVFLTSKAGSCANCFMASLTRTMSRSLRQTDDPELAAMLAKDLIGHSCPRSNDFRGSCVHQLGEAMRDVVKLLNGEITIDVINDTLPAKQLGEE